MTVAPDVAAPRAPLTGSSAWASVVALCQPFRAGPRFQALPSVTLDTPAGRVHHAGDLLPRLDETEPGAYTARLAAEGTEGWTLAVHQPWVDDPERWGLVRDALLEPFEEQGYPVLPVALDLVVTSATTWTAEDEPPGSQLVWLLHGEATIAVAGGPRHLTGGSSAVTVPDGPRAAVVRNPGSPVLLLLLATVSSDARGPVVALAHRVAAALDRARHDDAVPHLAAVLTSSGSQVPAAQQPVMEPLARARDALLGCVEDPGRVTATRLEWARRVSAAGLEPAPPPRPPRVSARLDAGARWVRRTRVVFGDDGSGGTVCAANGHAFRVRGTVAAVALAALNAAPTTSLDELAAAVLGPGAPASERAAAAAALAPLVEQLWRLRAVEELR